jgi:hypothetical protein
MQSFAPHGEYRISVESNTLLVEAKGLFNSEIVASYTTDMALAVKQVVAPWSQLIVLHQEGLFTPSAEKQMYSTIRARKDLGMCASGIVIIGAIARFAIEMQISRIYNDLQVKHQYFDNEKEARDWLLEVVSSVN